MSTPKLPDHTRIQINVPDDIHAQLKGYAGYRRKRLGELINELLKKFTDEVIAERAA